MSQCLRCEKESSASSILCDECQKMQETQMERDHLNHTRQIPFLHNSQAEITASNEEWDKAVSFVLTKRSVITDELAEEIQTQLAEESVMENMVTRLNDAARRIAEVEGQEKRPGLRPPRPSRLAPFHDITADIRRHSTPLPDSLERSRFERAEQAAPESAQKLPDLWPWFADVPEEEPDSWANRTDPLTLRRLPDSTAVARFEEEEMLKASANKLIPATSPDRIRLRKRWRTAFIYCLVIALIALIVDATLILMAFNRPPSQDAVPKVESQGGPPALTLSADIAVYGQPITLSVQHFAPRARILLTRDAHKPLQSSQPDTILLVGQDGSAQMTFVIDESWNTGSHTLEAEDLNTHYTANALFQVAEGAVRPSRLVPETDSLDLGVVAQGANKVQPFTLHNSGNVPLSWSASSDQPWLVLSPTQGTLSGDQTISIAVQSAQLAAGPHEGKIVFSTNINEQMTVVAKIMVAPFGYSLEQRLEVSPPALSFTAIDEGANPVAQSLRVSNSGPQPLRWLLIPQVPESTNQSVLRNNTNWLTVDHFTGVVAPLSSETVRVQVDTSQLLPNVYSALLAFKIGEGESSSTQQVSVSLTVQEPCKLVPETGRLSFTSVIGRGNPNNQAFNLKTNNNCTGITAWSATTSADWLKITPAQGQLHGMDSATSIVSVETGGLVPRTYSATITLVTAKSTQTIKVQLIVQTPPPPASPIIAAAPLDVNFTIIQGQSNPPGQAVTITNAGESELAWRAQTERVSWLSIAPSSGTILVSETGQMTINIDADSLSPGTYIKEIVLSGTGPFNRTASGGPQTITVRLVITAPCTLSQPSSSALAFSLQPEANTASAEQAVTLTATGGCSWPLNWKAHIADDGAAWLKLSATSGTITADGKTITLVVSPNGTQVAPGVYNARIIIEAIDSNQEPVKTQTVTVALTVPAPSTP